MKLKKIAYIEVGKKDKQKSLRKKCTNSIKEKVKNYSSDNIITYLRGMAYNIDFWFFRIVKCMDVRNKSSTFPKFQSQTFGIELFKDEKSLKETMNEV